MAASAQWPLRGSRAGLPGGFRLRSLRLLAPAQLASLAYFRRRYDEAEASITEALEIEPSHAVMRLQLARVYVCSGRCAEALEQTRWCMRALPGMAGPRLWHVAALAWAGELDAARTSLRQFDADPAMESCFPVWRAMACTAIGEPDRALQWLEMAAAQRDYWFPNVAVEPAFDALRPRAEFARILADAGLSCVA